MNNKKDWLRGFVSVFKGDIIEILRKPSMKNRREIARRSPGVRIIAITEKNEFIISQEYREYLEKEIDNRLPGGKVVDKLKEYLTILSAGTLKHQIELAARKELSEETGITADTIELFCVSTSGGTIDWDLYYYIAKGLTFGTPKPEEDEKIEVLTLSLIDTIDLVLLKQMSEDRSRMVLLDYLLQEHPIEVAERIKQLNKKSV